ncbi:hypothetical protein Q8A67_018158 [Cirrhinus molitorella]|uniref:Uncharacterized protein n=1 Tax=Cirrhinus molitorella TaxID=172907 RepID=A0AA88TQG8_9TELE|nr:hypothetical protein Q8A67_018158 [Cirrhinus molitorella]
MTAFMKEGNPRAKQGEIHVLAMRALRPSERSISVSAVQTSDPLMVPRWKAFHTCLTHLLLVLLYYMPVMVAYVLGNLRLVGNVDLFTAILTISVTIPPMLNPIIYSLKTDELRDKIVKLLGKTKVANG